MIESKLKYVVNRFQIIIKSKHLANRDSFSQITTELQFKTIKTNQIIQKSVIQYRRTLQKQPE